MEDYFLSLKVFQNPFWGCPKYRCVLQDTLLMGWYFFSSVAILKQPLKFLARSEVYLAQTIWFLRHKQPGSNHHSGLKSKGKNKPVSCPQVPSGRGHWSRQWHMSESLGLSCRNRTHLPEHILCYELFPPDGLAKKTTSKSWLTLHFPFQNIPCMDAFLSDCLCSGST